MYKALYRKYRPTTFSEVVGQPHITVTLKNQLVADRLSHAYLFTGSRGTGKTSCAKILAKAVNCLQLKEGDPCNQCENCRAIDAGSMMDVLEIDAASNNGVENIRDLREKANYTPAAGKYRVYIIDEVHMLSTGAFNALLKTLEEPPAHMLFILATTEVHKLPATILSRCQRFDFRRIAPEEIAARIQTVAKAEQFSVEPDAALLIARISDGGLRDAISLLDICAGAGETITEQIVTTAAGLAGRDYLISLSQAVLKEDTANALEIIDRLHNASLDMQRLCEELISHYRNLLLCKTLKEPQKLIAASSGELDELQESAKKTPLPLLLHALSLFEDTLQRIGAGASRRVEMELAFVKLCAPSLDSSPDGLSRRISALEQAVRSGGGLRSLPVDNQRQNAAEPVIYEQKTEQPAESFESEEKAQKVNQISPRQNTAGTAPDPAAEKNEPEAENTDVNREQEKEPVSEAAYTTNDEVRPCAFWPEVLEILFQKNPLIAAVLKNADVYIKNEYILIDPHSDKFREMVNNQPHHRDSIRSAAAAVTGIQYKLGPYTQNEARSQKQSDPMDSLKEKLKNAGF